MAKFKSHKHLKVPAWNATLWRYMSITKFLDLVLSQRLCFVSPTQFSDGYEVTLPENIVNLLNEHKGGIGDLYIEKMVSEVESMRKNALVSCWAQKRTESFAHWKVYLDGGKSGVAIKTNFKRLQEAVSAQDIEIFVGKVSYKDSLPLSKMSKESIITTKRTFYEYENEVRLFIQNNPQLGNSDSSTVSHVKYAHVDVDLDLLIDEIYLSPFEAAWFPNILTEVLRALNPNLVSKIRRSSIIDA